MHEEHDIVARAGNAAGTSVGALAAYIGRSCGHATLDERVVSLGYRFHPWMSDEIPHFFNKRFTTGTTNLAITLQAGLSLEGEDPFEACISNAEARELIASQQLHDTFWLARVTMGTDLLDVADVADPLFIARHPNEFRLIAEELVALGVLQAHACQLCRMAHDEEQ